MTFNGFTIEEHIKNNNEPLKFNISIPCDMGELFKERTPPIIENDVDLKNFRELFIDALENCFEDRASSVLDKSNDYYHYEEMQIEVFDSVVEDFNRRNAEENNLWVPEGAMRHMDDDYNFHLQIQCDIHSLFEEDEVQPLIKSEDDFNEFRNKFIDEMEYKITDQEEFISLHELEREVFNEVVDQFNTDKEEEEEDDCSDYECDELDMKILGFKTTERLDGDWNSLLFGIRNHECDE